MTKIKKTYAVERNAPNQEQQTWWTCTYIQPKFGHANADDATARFNTEGTRDLLINGGAILTTIPLGNTILLNFVQSPYDSEHQLEMELKIEYEHQITRSLLPCFYETREQASNLIEAEIANQEVNQEDRGLALRDPAQIDRNTIHFENRLLLQLFSVIFDDPFRQIPLNQRNHQNFPRVISHAFGIFVLVFGHKAYTGRIADLNVDKSSGTPYLIKQISCTTCVG